MGQHRRIAWNKKAAPYVTTAVALDLVGLFGFAYLTDSHVPGISPLAATSIFIDGTKDILPTGDSQAADRMRDALSGQYDQCPGVATCTGNVYVDYPRDFGILTGGVGYDVSRGIAATNTLAAIKQARADNPCTQADCSDSPIYVVGYSQGANASSDVLKQIEANNAGKNPGDAGYIDTRGLTFVMLGNGARNDGGLWARLPAGVYVPLLGLDFGASTNPSNDPNAPQVLMITKQYDGAADWPRYVLVNPLAAVNAAMGFMYVHNGYYKDVNVSDLNATLDTNHDGTISDAEIAANNANPDSPYIVNRNGNVTDVLIKNQPGDLPITQPLKDLGVPADVIKAIDPLLRAIIEAGYQRPTDGVYPAQPVHFGLIPKPNKMFHDFLAIEAGADQTAENVEALNPLQAAAPNVGSALSKQGNFAPTLAPPAPPMLPIKPRFNQQSPVSAFVAPQWVPQITPSQAPPTPPPPPAEEEPVIREVQEPVILNTQTSGNAQNVLRPSANASAGAGVQKITTAVNGVVTGAVTAIKNVLTPKPAGSSTPSSSAPTAPDPTPGTGDGTGTGNDTGSTGGGTTP